MQVCLALPICCLLVGACTANFDNEGFYVIQNLFGSSSLHSEEIIIRYIQIYLSPVQIGNLRNLIKYWMLYISHK